MWSCAQYCGAIRPIQNQVHNAIMSTYFRAYPTKSNPRPRAPFTSTWPACCRAPYADLGSYWRHTQAGPVATWTTNCNLSWNGLNSKEIIDSYTHTCNHFIYCQIQKSQNPKNPKVQELQNPIIQNRLGVFLCCQRLLHIFTSLKY